MNTLVTEEQHWIQYTGECVIFVGKYKVQDKRKKEDYKKVVEEKWVFETEEEDYGEDYEEAVEEKWVLETEEETKHRLTAALMKAGIMCDDITIKWTDETHAQRSCYCICYYQKHYKCKHLYIQGLTTVAFDYERWDENCAPMGFYIVKCETDEYVLK